MTELRLTAFVLCLVFMTGCEKNASIPQEDPWRLFAEALAEAGQVIERSATPQDELTRAEGLRYLARLIGEGVKTTVEGADSSRPLLAAKLFSGGDTSDARYSDAIIDGSRTYRIHGDRGTAPLIEFTVYDGKIGVHDASKQIGSPTERQLVITPDGGFEIFLSPDPHPKNWIQTTPRARYLLIRQYSHDWRTTRSATFTIEALGPKARSPLQESQIQDGLLATARFVRSLAEHWAKTVDRIRLLPANTMVRVPRWVGNTLPAGHRFAAGEFELGPDDALIIEFDAPKAPYWGFQLVNYWFEPIDYGGTGSHLNNRTAVVRGDGSVRLVVSDRDPQSCNWLDTRGHRVGTMQFRLSRADDLGLPSFHTRVVKVSEVDALGGCGEDGAT